MTGIPLGQSPITEPLLRAYSCWLYYERRLLHMEIFPSLPEHAENVILPHGKAMAFHFPTESDGRGKWWDQPKPSTRAASVLRAVGVEWGEKVRDLPVSWGAFPAGAEPDPDAHLIRLGRELDEAVAEATRLRTEFCRLENEHQARTPRPEELRVEEGEEGIYTAAQLRRPSARFRFTEEELAELIPIAEAYEAHAAAVAEELGLEAADKAAAEAEEIAEDLAQEIAEMEARTLAGLAVQVRAVKWGNSSWWDAKTGEPDAFSWADQLAAEILDAVQQLAALHNAAPAGEA